MTVPAGCVPAAGERHLVHLYDDASTLLRGVAAYASTALRHGEAVLVVATPSTRTELATRLEAGGSGLAALRREGRYVERDAETVLEHLLRTDGRGAERVDADAFAALVEAELAQLTGRFGAVSAYGEMVACLWRRGAAAAAVALEDLWNELAARRDFGLYCGYDSAAFDREGTPGQAVRVLSAHSEVRCT